ncbi:hypothetical protein ACOSP7_030050 [Xanthoceras sorbifolium]
MYKTLSSLKPEILKSKMALLAGNIGLKMSGRPQFLVYFISWVRKNNEILCLKGRDYSSSVPVRYVPKKSSKVNESEDTFLRKSLEKKELDKSLDASYKLRNEVVKTGGRGVKRSVILDEKLRNQNQNQNQNEMLSVNNLLFDDDDAKQVQKLRNRDRDEISSKNNLLFDDDAKLVQTLQNGNGNERSSKNNLLLDVDAKQEFEEVNNDLGVVELGRMEESEEVIEEPEEVFEELEIPREKNIYEQKVVVAGKSLQDAENVAIKLLATRAFTAVELRKKLNGKKFPPDIVEAVLEDFKSRGLINDSLYAETFSRSRWSSSSWGPRRIKQALFNKGINNTDADKAVTLVFKDAESDDDQESKLGMSKLSMDHLFVQASKQWLRNQDAPEETRKVRIIRWLQYRGFNWGVTNFILKKLESQYPA